MQNDPDIVNDSENIRAAHRASDARRKERMRNDPNIMSNSYRDGKQRDQKRKAIEEDPLHSDARKDADRMVKVRRVARETGGTGCSGARGND